MLLGVVGDRTTQLVEACRSLGLAAPDGADRIRFPPGEEVIAVARCRILNDFEPLATIVDKSLRHRPEDVDCYVFAALASYCNRRGIELDVIAGKFPGYNVDLQIEGGGPLPLKRQTVFNVDLVTPAHEVMSTSVLLTFAQREPARTRDVFVDLASAISPRLNLKTTRAGEPSARIASRLIDYARW